MRWKSESLAWKRSSGSHPEREPESEARHGPRGPVGWPTPWPRLASPLVACALILAGCGGSVPQPRIAAVQGERPSPLGQSYTLNPLPSDDESLLGRVLDRPPAAGQSLEEVARPNPCADKLTEAKTLPSVATFDDAEELAVGGKASATLGTFGFSGDASRATHFVYKLETEKRASRVDTAEYEACCKEKGCGYGFVSALVYGSGEYATAEETSGSGGVNIAFAKAEGTAALKILHKRAVKGWVAALIRVTDQTKAPASSVGALGDPSAYGITLSESTLPDQVKKRYELDKVELNGRRPSVNGAPISENEFLRRYRERIGADAPAPAARYQAVWPAVGCFLGGAATAVGVAMVVASRPQQVDNAGITPATDDPDLRRAGFVVMLAGLPVCGLSLFLGWAVGRDDRAGEERVPAPDMELYVAKYNRVLLRKVVKDADERIRALQGRAATPRPEFSFHASPFGITGTF